MGNSARKGQSMQEFAIVLCLAVMVAIGALSGLGTHISSLFNGLLGDGAKASAVGNANAGSGVNGLVGLVSPPTAKPGGKASGVLTGSGVGAPLATNASSPTDSSTSSRDGVTSAWASQMGEVAEKLLATGEIDEKQYNTLIALANQGHRIAAIQKIIQNAWTSSGEDIDVFKTMPVVFDGKTYTARDLTNVLDGYGADFLNGDAEPNDGSREWGLEIVKFRALYQQALANGSLDDPSALSSINELGNQIVDRSESLQSAVEAENLSPFADSSTDTHRDSGGICVTGSGRDSGTNCAH